MIPIPPSPRSRFRFLRSLLPGSCLALLTAILSVGGVSFAKDDAPRPNVVFIAIDDLNDWIGCMGGHPLVKTPHIDALAGRGTLFTNAHCQAPLCNPSRTSLMLGLRPGSTGIHGLSPWFRDVPEFADHVALPQAFAAEGYRTYTAGKIYHSWRQPRPNDRHVEFDESGPAGGLTSRPPEKLVGETPFGNHPLMDWGVWPPDNDDSVTGDYQVASWAVEKIGQMPDDQPFFLAAGFFFPHVPCFATQKWFDLYPEDESILPPIRENERAETPFSSWWIHWSLPEPRLRWVQESGQHVNLVRSYLACISFIDSLVGRIVAAVDEKGIADDTIIVLWSDHGFHLGEKEITGKNTLWGRSTKVPLIFAGPGVEAGQVCTEPVELLDIYPTLIDLAGVPAPPHALDGLSLRPQLEDAAAERDRPAITSHNQGNYSVVTRDWRFIRYVDGSEEIYHIADDPHEWYNIAAERGGMRAHLRAMIPNVDRGPAPGSANRILTFYDNIPVWEGTPIAPDAEVPHDSVTAPPKHGAAKGKGKAKGKAGAR